MDFFFILWLVKGKRYNVKSRCISINQRIIALQNLPSIENCTLHQMPPTHTQHPIHSSIYAKPSYRQNSAESIPTPRAKNKLHFAKICVQSALYVYWVEILSFEHYTVFFYFISILLFRKRNWNWVFGNVMKLRLYSSWHPCPRPDKWPLCSASRISIETP